MSRLFLLVAALSVVLIVPDWPHRHLAEPSYLGALGFGASVVLFLAQRRLGWARGGLNRRLGQVFLFALPIFYVASWARHGASAPLLAVELCGVAIWLAFAITAGRANWALWLGCLLHAAWDAAHFARTDYPPEWYIAACLAADVAVAAYLYAELQSRPADRL